MSKYRKHITEFDCCPHCGSEDGFIQHFYVSGWSYNCVSWEGVKENTESLDHLNYSREGKYYHCCSCEKRIAKVDDNLNYLIGENGWVRDLEERIKQLDYED